MEHFEMTNLERVEKLLSEITSRRVNVKTTKETENKTMGYFKGKIGPDVKFTGKWVRAVEQTAGIACEYKYEEIDLAAQGQPIARLGTKNDFMNLAAKRKSAPTKMFWVVSPKYDDKGCVTKANEATKQLQVFHAQDETADNVIDEICDIVAYSKAKAAADKKYSELNLATRLADLNREM